MRDLSNAELNHVYGAGGYGKPTCPTKSKGSRSKGKGSRSKGSRGKGSKGKGSKSRGW